jgi:hypothetical protein
MAKTKRYKQDGYVTSDDSNAGMAEAYDEGALERANSSAESQAIADEAKGEGMLKSMRDEATKPKAKVKAVPKNPNYSNEGRNVPAPAAKSTSKVGRAGQASGSSSDMSFQDKQAMEYLQAKKDKAAGKDTSFFGSLFGGSQRDRKYKTGSGMASGGMTASRRADGIATKGKTRGKIC